MRLTGLWWWIDRWRKSSAYTTMTLEQQGAYRNLLDEAALRGGAVPNDDGLLGRACGDARRWRKVRAVVLAQFKLTPDGWRNSTMDEVLAESQRRAAKQFRYRHSHGNERGNERGNARGNGQSHDRGNNPRPPDPDPDPVFLSERSPREITRTEERETDPAKRAGGFCEWYADTHHRLFGIGYMGSQKDYQSAVQLVTKFSDEQLHDAALVWFGMDDDFATNGTRTIPKFASRVTGCLQQIRQHGIA